MKMVTKLLLLYVVCSLLRSIICDRKSIVNIRGFHSLFDMDMCRVSLVGVVAL